MPTVSYSKWYVFLTCRLADNRRTRYREAQFFSYMLGMYNWKHSTCNETTIILYSADDGVVSLYNKILRWIDIPEFCLRVSYYSPLEEFALTRGDKHKNNRVASLDMLRVCNWKHPTCIEQRNCTLGPGCSKLTTSLDDVSLKFQMLISKIRHYFLQKKCYKLLQCKSFSRFSTKNISVFG